MMGAALEELTLEGHNTYAAAVVHRADCGCGTYTCYGFEPTSSSLASARRALHRLSDLGLVDLVTVQDPWSSRRWMVARRKTAKQ